MGRFYKTSQPENIDFMFKLPENLMLQATQQAAQDIEQNYVATLSLQDKLQLPAFGEADKNRAKQIIASYEEKINALTQQLQENPLEFRRKSGDITALARDINSNWSKGEAAGIMDNYTKFNEMQKRYEKMIQSGQIKDPYSVPYLFNNIKEKFEAKGGTKYNPETGGYNQIELEELTPYVDLPSEFDKYVEKMKPTIMAQSGIQKSPDGMYLRTTNYKTEVLSEQDILNTLWGRFVSDTNVHQYLRQREKIGVLPGSYDEFGNPISLYDKSGRFVSSPFSVVEKKDAKGNVIKDKRGNPVRELKWNPNNYLTGVMQGTINKYAVHNVLEDSVDIKAEPYAYLAEQMKGASPTPLPDSKTQTMQVRNTLKTPGAYKETVEAPARTLQAYQTYAANSPQIKSMNSTTLAQYQKDTKDAELLAARGDFQGAYGIVAKYGDPNLVMMLKNFANEQIQAEAYGTQEAVIKSMISEKNPNFTPEQVEAEFAKVIERQDLKQRIANVNITFGNTWSDLSPTVQKQVSKSISALNEILENPQQWGDFYYVPQDKVGEKKGESSTQKTNIQELNKAGVLDVDKLIQDALRASQEGYLEEEGGEGDGTPKLKNKTAKAGLLTNTPYFEYFEIGADGKPVAGETQESWLIALPIYARGGKDNKGKLINTVVSGTIYIPASNFNDPKLEQLKLAVENQRLEQAKEDLYNNVNYTTQKLAREYGVKKTYNLFGNTVEVK